VDVQLVNVPITVRTDNLRSSRILSKNDVELFEDGKQQTPRRYLRPEAERPITLGILFDSTGRLQRLLPVEQEALGDFLEGLFGPQDMAFLISFSTIAELVQDLTSSVPALRGALQATKTNPRTEQPLSGGELPGSIGLPPRRVILYDAIYLAIEEKLASEAGRKILIIVTDGQDQGSTYKLQEAVAAAQKENVTCFPLVIANRYHHSHDYPFDMKKLARETGGRLFFFSYFDALRIQKPRKAFRELAASLRNQYSLGFVPQHPPDGRFHRVRIHSKTGSKIDAPAAYYSGPIPAE
jgi:VWFA-related protein